MSSDNTTVDWLADRIGSHPQELKEQKLHSIATILMSLRDVRIHQCAAFLDIDGLSLEKKPDLVEEKWLAKDMDKQLSKIWIRYMSATALDWYSKKMVGSTAGATCHRVCLMAHFFFKYGVKARAGKGEPISETAKNVAQAVLRHGSTNEEIEAVACFLQNSMLLIELKELEAHLFSPEGCLFTAGKRAMFIDESICIYNFRNSVQSGNAQ